MEAVELLKIFSDPDQIQNLTTGQRLWAGLITTILGMGITAVVLVLLQIVTTQFERFSDLEKAPPKPAKKSAPAVAETKAEPEPQPDDGLVPAITTAIAMMLETSASDIHIRSIRRSDDTAAAWNRAGIAEQMQNRV